MAATKTALIFGAGSNIGAASVKAFLGAGYHVATVSRSSPSSSSSSTPTPSNILPIQADLSDVAAIPGIYERVAAAGWEFPSLVVWNAASITRPVGEDPNNPLEVPLDGFDTDLNLMVRSPYVAAREAVREWKKAEGSRKGTFVMTGNLLPKKILKIPALVTCGVGKAGGNYWVGLSDAVFRDQGIR